MNTVIFIQARMSSTRLPGKMLMDFYGMPLVEFVYRRCLESRRADRVVVVTSDHATDDILTATCRQREIPVFRGPLEDVLGRYLFASRHYKAHIVCRVCGDSPFVDVAHLDALASLVASRKYEYALASNCMRGFMSEAMTSEALEQANTLDKDSGSREHVTSLIRKKPELFRTTELPGSGIPDCLSNIGLTIDVVQDLDLARAIISSGLSIPGFTSEDVLRATLAVLWPQGRSKTKEVHPYA